LTSGALVGGLVLAVFSRKGRAAPVIGGMLVSLVTMAAIEILPNWAVTKPVWMSLVGTGIFWPWYTLIGATVTLTVAWLLRKLFPTLEGVLPGEREQAPEERDLKRR
jgi:hypothetical protein